MNDPVYTANVLNGRKEDGTDIHSVNMRAAKLPDRDKAKTFFYGFLFGSGDAKTGKIVGGTAALGRELKDEFLKGLPALAKLLEELTAQWRKTARQKFNARFNRMEYFDGTIIGLDGRPIVVPSEHMILVYLLQSDEAIMMTRAYNTVWRKLSEKYKFGEDFGVVCFYHDEIDVECREEIAEDVRKISEDAIVEAGEYYKISCPHRGEGKIGKNWYEIH
jgi:DNA polymerase I-like protein with 3'-5' exonuclease and polymerase domains